MKTKNILTSLMTLLLILGLSTTKSLAQSSNNEDIMLRAERNIYKTCSSQASFTSVYYDAQNRELNKQKGTIYLQGDLFRLEYGDILATYDGKTLVHHDDIEETLTISEPTNEELLQINPLHFLRSRGKGFDVQMDKKQKGIERLIYKPKGKSNLKQVIIDYRQSDAMPTKVTLLTADKGRIELNLNSFKALNTEFPANRFTLSKKDYPQSEVVDLR